MKQDVEKQSLRKKMKAIIESIPPLVRKEKSRIIASTLFSHPMWHTMDTILLFLSFDTEVQTDDMVLKALADNKIVAIPRIIGKKMNFHRITCLDSGMPESVFGIREPDPRLPVMSLKDLRTCLVITPGLAFDREKNRLGRGGGFYDTFLGDIKNMKEDSIICAGVCFSEQLIHTVPVCSYDMKVHMIVSDKEIIR